MTQAKWARDFREPASRQALGDLASAEARGEEPRILVWAGRAQDGAGDPVEAAKALASIAARAQQENPTMAGLGFEAQAWSAGDVRVAALIAPSGLADFVANWGHTEREPALSSLHAVHQLEGLEASAMGLARNAMRLADPEVGQETRARLARDAAMAAAKPEALAKALSQEPSLGSLWAAQESSRLAASSVIERLSARRGAQEPAAAKAGGPKLG